MGGENQMKIEKWMPPGNPKYIPPPPKGRPKFSLVSMVLDLLLPLGLILWLMSMLEQLPQGAVVLVILLYIMSRLKQMLLWLVLIYQRFAAERVRQSCTFTPSCSEYMILSIEKYGTFPGFVKGIGRLLRCRGHYNGEDYP